MAQYLIEIPHQNSKKECLKAIGIFKTTGSHLLTQADWGCPDDIHKAWIRVEVDNKEEALNIVPPWYRDEARVITLEKLAMDGIEQNMEHHQD